MKVRVKKLHDNAVIPKYAKEGDAGLDLTAVTADSISEEDRHVIVYGTGLAVEIPEGHVGLVFPRSSVYKHATRQANCVGVIDSNYRGEIKVVHDLSTPMITHIVASTVEEDETILEGFMKHAPNYKEGDRVAQLVIIPIPNIELEEVTELSETNRGEGGFGSTGK